MLIKKLSFIMALASWQLIPWKFFRARTQAGSTDFYLGRETNKQKKAIPKHFNIPILQTVNPTDSYQ